MDRENQLLLHPGNGAQYAPENQSRRSRNALTGKRILFLGSSVTLGYASQGASVADYLAARDGCEIVKEAVSGTTLVDTGSDSYIARLERLPREKTADLFVCQLSTNDASLGMPLGRIPEAGETAVFDTSTVCGAIAHIITRARQLWDCPVLFYTSPRYDSPAYAEMVSCLRSIAQKQNVLILDMWGDDCFEALRRDFYMADPIHPTRAGYLCWWLPYWVEKLPRLAGFAETEG